MIEGPSVLLRPFDRCHLDRTRAWNNDADLCHLLGRYRPVSDQEHESWYATTIARSDAVFFAIHLKEGDRHIGNVWLNDIEPRHRKAEVRIVVGEPSALGRGAGSEALDLICTYAFQMLNLGRVYAYVLGINPRARRAFEKAGFVVEGTLRADRWAQDRYTDVHLMGRLREDRR